jgi:flagellin
VSFSINTNVASLQAQNNLRASGDFQSKTIERVTSGLRIVNSGDDAAGLAIANGFRSDQAVLSQGIRNSNDGLSTLQTIDGGINNISQLLDRARTLATQSASDTFTGDRSVLNTEFQSVIGEINRQAQSIGLNQGGDFAKNLSVFIGGGRGADSSAIIANGTVSVDLTKSTVDAQSLGLVGLQAVGTGANLESTSATSVSSIINDATNVAGNPAVNTTQFTFFGNGFTAGAQISVNLSGVTDTSTLVTAINSAIQGATQQGSPAATAFGNAGITASVVKDASGHEELAFTSSKGAFQVQANDLTSNALVGNLAVGGAPTGGATTERIDANGSSQAVAGGLAFTALGATDKQTLSFVSNDPNGAAHSTSVTLDNVSGASVATAVAAINTQLQGTNDPTLQNFVAVADNTTGTINFLGNSSFVLSLGANSTAAKGLGSGAQQGTTLTSTIPVAGATADISNNINAAAAVTAIASAVSTLGNAQAAVGKGENQLNFAISLAQSQVTNLAAAESRIRDADRASEAANLTKAQILIQAGTAALAQANSAPQAILSLLKS